MLQAALTVHDIDADSAIWNVPVLSQMTEVHAGFLMIMRSVSVCMYIIMLQL